MTTTTNPAGNESIQPSEEDGPWNFSMGEMAKATGRVVGVVKEAAVSAADTVSSFKPWEMAYTELKKFVAPNPSATLPKTSTASPRSVTGTVQALKQGLYYTPEKITPVLQKLKTLYDDKLIKAESGGKHYEEDGKTLTTSPVGALGISQIMPATGESPGYGIKPLRDQSEEEYRRFGFDMLVAMDKKYKGDIRKALAAYNFGPGNVDSAVRKARRKGINWEAELPKETRDYLKKIAGK